MTGWKEPMLVSLRLNFLVFPTAHSDGMILMSVRLHLVENEKWFFI
jgi:hypothetical protein